MNPFRAVLVGAIVVSCNLMVAATDGSAEEECKGQDCMPAPQECSGADCAATLDNPVRGMHRAGLHAKVQDRNRRRTT